MELQQHAALRGQNTGARAREEVVHDVHVALRRQKTPPPGVRPGSLVSSVRPSAGGVARRRRERRLRSWWRHEQQTVRMALAAATHHSAQQNSAPRGPKTGARAREEVEYEKHAGLRAQKTPPPGERPGILAEPGPQRSDRTVRRSSGETPLLVALLADASADGVDAATLSFHTASALEARRKEEEERRKREEQEELNSLRAVPPERRTVQQVKRISDILLHRCPPRKRKKRRKRRTPRTSFLPGRARRRQRQWSACYAGFTGDDVPRVMIPSGVVRPKMLRIMAGMVQKDSCSGIARLVLLMTVHLVLCFLPSLQARDARHHGQYGPEGLVCWFLVKVFYMPVVVLRVVSWSRQCSIWLLQFITVVVSPC